MTAASRSGVEVVATGGLVAGAGATAVEAAEACADEDFDLRPNNTIEVLRKEVCLGGFDP